MKAVLSFALLSALALTTSAVSVNKVRRDAPPVPTYVIETITSDGNVVNTPATNGVVYETFDPINGPFLTHAEIDDENPAGTTTCVARDQWGNQVRAFGGPNFGGVEAVDFVPADGQQIFSLSCYPAEGSALVLFPEF